MRFDCCLLQRQSPNCCRLERQSHHLGYVFFSLLTSTIRADRLTGCNYRLWKHLLQRALLHRHPTQPQRPAHLRLQLPPEPYRQLQDPGRHLGPVGRFLHRVVQPRCFWLSGQRRRLRQLVHAQRRQPQAHQQQPVRHGRPVWQLHPPGCSCYRFFLGGLYDPPKDWCSQRCIHHQGWQQRPVGYIG